MDISIVLVDDLEEDRIRLEKAIRRFFSLQMNDRIRITDFPSGEAMLPEFSPGRFHLAFLDIVMNEMNGIALAKKLRATDAHLLIVFQTTSREYAFDAFPVHPFDYLMKPWEEKELDGVLTEAMRVIRAGDPEITVASGRETFSVPLRKISSVTAAGHTVYIHLEDGTQFSSTDSFKNISGKLSADPRFLLINRGILINMNQVLSPKDGVMEMKDGRSHPIRVNGRSSVLSAFTQYMISRVDRR